ncbi:MAG: FAD binding domain-containing protein, partial [Acidobacteriota bacterium]|nr:FAD binding domain-containing protein [Acidobacteriota bacterium]
MAAAAVTINGRSTPLADVAPWTSALDFLREQGLTGCKEGCAEGECGACSILVARPGLAAATEWVAVNACLVPIAALDGQELVTAEGLGDPGALHPVQHEMAIRGGSQCGYCTPGFVCSMAAEYYRPDRAALDGHADAEHGPNGFDLHALSGNLCRCTGYRPIRDAAYALDAPRPGDELALRLRQAPPAPVATRLRGEGGSFVRPATLDEALELIRSEPEAVVIAGCTDHGVEVNLRGSRPKAVIAIDRLEELRTFAADDDTIELGAALSLSEIERRLDGRVPLLATLFPQFASRLIRNTATIGGNLGTCSPIGDCPPPLLALDARIVLAGPSGDREVELATFFTGYRTNVCRD